MQGRNTRQVMSNPEKPCASHKSAQPKPREVILNELSTKAKLKVVTLPSSQQTVR
jgi:hypothetical protein